MDVLENNLRLIFVLSLCTNVVDSMMLLGSPSNMCERSVANCRISSPVINLTWHSHAVGYGYGDLTADWLHLSHHVTLLSRNPLPTHSRRNLLTKREHLLPLINFTWSVKFHERLLLHWPQEACNICRTNDRQLQIVPPAEVPINPLLPELIPWS
jgi:hypothetical protein